MTTEVAESTATIHAMLLNWNQSQQEEDSDGLYM